MLNSLGNKKMGDIYLDNIDLNEKEFNEKKIVLESKLRRIMITLTNECNFRCKMCRWSIRKKDLTLPDEYIKQITKLFPYLDYIAWQGGEVFLVDYFKDVFRKIMQYPNILQEITTNASLITEDWAELISMSNIRLIVSIDSLDKETFSHIRRGGSLEDVIRNISLINKARERNNNTRFEMGLNIIVMRSNYKELETFIDFAKQYKFNFLNFMYLVDTLAPEEHIFEPLDLEPLNYLRESMPKIINRARDYGIRVCYEFEPLLSRGSIVINISSLMGSISDNKSGGGYSYRISKAALNMVSKNLSIDWADKGIIILNMHPGWVRTDMGGTQAPLSKKISVRGMIDVIKKVKDRDSGKFINYDGAELPW